MPPEDQGELGGAAAAHGDPRVGHPDRGRVPQPAQAPVGARHLVQAHEGRLPAPVVLNGAVQGVQPIISLLDIPGKQEHEKIAENVFSNNTNLHVLNIAHNKIHTIEQESFKKLNNLRALRLDNNQLKDINGLVSSQKNLRWLNVSANSLQWFDFAFIPKSLEWLDLHNNNVDKIGNYYSLSHGFNLRTFDASFNRIKYVQAKSLLSGLENIYLNNNNIKDVAPESFSSLGNLSRVELQGNEMVNIELSALATAQTGKY